MITMGPFIPQALAITFSDPSFLSQDWTPIIHVRDDPAVAGVTSQGSVGNMTRQTSGGNPGAYFRSLIGLDFGDIINTSGIYIAETYDPSERAISTLNFTYSVNHFNNTPNTETSVLPALLQDGRLFVGAEQIFSGNTWITRFQNNLVADDFLAVDVWFTGEVIHPDFSAFGESIQFGYSFQNDVAFGDGFVATRGLDNWAVTVNLAAMSDIHGDGVDSQDLDFWTTGFGTAVDSLLTDGDFDRDDDVDGADFLKWQREFGNTGGLQSFAVPEPSTLWLCLASGLIFLRANSNKGLVLMRHSSFPLGYPSRDQPRATL